MKSLLLCIALIAGLAMNLSNGSNHFTYLDLEDRKVYRKYEKIVLNYLKNHVAGYSPKLKPKKLLVAAEFRVNDITSPHGDLNVIYQDNRDYGCFVDIPGNLEYNQSAFMCTDGPMNLSHIAKGWKQIEYLGNLYGNGVKPLLDLLQSWQKYFTE